MDCSPHLFQPPGLGSHFNGGKIPFLPKCNWGLDAFKSPNSFWSSPQVLFKSSGSPSALWMWLWPKPSSFGNSFITMSGFLPLFLASAKSLLARDTEIVSSSSACRIRTGVCMEGSTCYGVEETYLQKRRGPGLSQMKGLQLWVCELLGGNGRRAFHKKPVSPLRPPLISAFEYHREETNASKTIQISTIAKRRSTLLTDQYMCRNLVSEVVKGGLENEVVDIGSCRSHCKAGYCSTHAVTPDLSGNLW